MKTYKPTREDLATNLLRARWLISEFEKLHPEFESLYLIFIDSILKSHYGSKELKRLFALAPTAMTEISRI